MILKKIKSFIAVFFIATFIMPQSILAYSKYIVAGGENIGLQIKNKGIIISGFYKVNNKYIASSSNLRLGDIIVNVNNNKVESIDDFISVINNSNNCELKIEYIRDGINNKTVLNMELVDDTYKTGLFVKDVISGVGTLTYIDPNSKLYGALGHEIIDSSSGYKIEVKEGSIYESKVTSIEKSIRGEPGSKNANTDSNKVFGNINENTSFGVFGNYTGNINTTKLYEVAEYKDIKLKEAKLITVLEDNIKTEYKINILKVNNDITDNKNILFEITDENLISKTGGIVQGMSGSPIIQDDKIIGAVTNVIVNNPKRGYGILITTMLNEAEN